MKEKTVAESKQISIPDIGDFKDVPVIEVLVKPGDSIKLEDPLIVLESDKATIEVPSPLAGVIENITVKVGDKVSEGTPILTIQTQETDNAPPTAQPAPASAPSPSPASPAPAQIPKTPETEGNIPKTEPPAPVSAGQSRRPPVPSAAIDEAGFAKAHASPSVRKFARELGVNLGLVTGTGPKQRILKGDVQAYVKAELSKPRGAGAELNLLPWPQVDFAKFGPVQIKPLSRIKKISGANLHRNWVMIPHVTQFDEADITELEALRKESNEATEKEGVKVTILAFLLRASISALKKFPEFNALLENNSADMNLVIKNYYHIGFAADTPNGLVVPVIRNVDQKGVIAIGSEMANLASLAREGKLKPAEMQGASFTISSLGGIGGTAFTPIIIRARGRHPRRFACRHQACLPGWAICPAFNAASIPSYDHRVIDGATAARFTSHLVEVLADLRRVLL